MPTLWQGLGTPAFTPQMCPKPWAPSRELAEDSFCTSGATQKGEESMSYTRSSSFLHSATCFRLIPLKRAHSASVQSLKLSLTSRKPSNRLSPRLTKGLKPLDTTCGSCSISNLSYLSLKTDRLHTCARHSTLGSPQTESRFDFSRHLLSDVFRAAVIGVREAVRA